MAVVLRRPAPAVRFVSPSFEAPLAQAELNRPQPQALDLQPDEIAARAPSYELAFIEAGRALDAQERAVNELRSRAGVLVAAAAVTTSFFGGRVLIAQHQHVATWIAIAAFGAVGAAVLAVLWPRHDREFSADARDIIAEYVEPEAVSLALIHRDLALHRAASYAGNARQLGALFLAFRCGLFFLVVEVASWVVALTEAT